MLVGITISSALIFSNIIGLPHGFAVKPDTDVREVFKYAQSTDGKFKNYIAGQLIFNAFEPVIFLIKAVSYPTASVVALCGGLFTVHK